MRQGLARHYLEKSVNIRIAETARVGGDTDDIGDLIEDIMRLETGHLEAGYDRLAENQRKRREACEVLSSGVIPPNTVLSNVPPSTLSGLGEKYTTQSQNESTIDDSFRALSYVHSMSIRHKDIKPANILSEDENVIFTDFGIAHAFAG